MAILWSLPSSFFQSNPNPVNLISPKKPQKLMKSVRGTCFASIKAPPPGFDFRSSDLFSVSRAAISKSYPELVDLVDMGCLILVQKDQFGPVPKWRTEFVEPQEIWLLGTTHIDPASPVHVDRLIRALRPDNVVVELCRSRAGIMYTTRQSEPGQQLRSNMFSLSGAEFFGAVGRSINLGGQIALALRLLLAIFSSKISSDVDRPFGDEFRAARIASEEIGAQIVLGDRPIEITLERVWNSLNWTQRLGLVGSIVRGITSSPNSSRENVQESDADDNPYQLYEKLSLSYPSLVQPLINERDTYLAWSLKRSKAVNNCKRVVGVIGKGHLNGVIHALVSDLGDLRFRDLTGKSSSSDDGMSGLGKKFLKDLARDTLIGIILWALYEQIKFVS